ncbi:efflux RND transporter periplasmic adaptor subunit [Thiohalorhabdus methylotrophus]|uniref:Efflux RND transporter periplasmic adaptor subunit n=1 Tax=Thiohalorhabdus methylotrophus TaxID=3242694 RepID=A0ABV4TWT5_9GAMM
MPLPKLPRSVLVATLIAVALVLWMASGLILPGKADRNGENDPGADIRGALTVQVRGQTARPVTRYIINQGQTETERLVTVRAETSGRVAEVAAPEGSRVADGQVLVRLAMDDREARLRQAQALVDQRETEFEAAKRLGSGGFQARSRVEEAEAALEQARAQLAQVREDIANTEIRVPFAGVLEQRAVEVGDYLRPGDQVAQVADLDPLIVSVRVAQQRIGEVRRGRPAEVRLVNGRTVKGTIRYVARTADEGTRTFRVEVAVPNAEAASPAGMSAEVRIPVGRVDAHFLSPALLTLNDEGELGVKTVEGESRVAFYAVSLVRSTADGVWVSGLPEKAQVITVGQGFAREGETVRPVPAPRSGVPIPEKAPEGGPFLPEVPGARPQ